MGRQVLLVEGVADTAFYAAFCRECGLGRIEVTAPRAVGAQVDSKTNAIHILPILLEQLNDATISSLGIVVDADYQSEYGLGFTGTLTKIREQLSAQGFLSEERLKAGGFLFKHPDGLAPFGAWVMPDNANDGMLEDFIKASILVEEQRILHAHATRTVGRLRSPLFKPIHRSKADVATWLSWQRMPGAGIENTIGNVLIDLSSPSCHALSQWLITVFT